MCVQVGYDFDKAFSNTVEFVRQLMAMTGIPSERVLQHYDVCAKNCPSQIRAKGMWSEFQKRISNSSSSGQKEDVSGYTKIMGKAVATTK